MSEYAAEPVPSNVDRELSEYLMRQLVAIQYSLSKGQFTIPTVITIPEVKIPGAMVMLNRDDGGNKSLNGTYVCQPTSTGDFEWKRLLPDSKYP